MLKKALAVLVVAVVLITSTSVSSLAATSDEPVFKPMTGGQPPWKDKP